MTRRFRPFAKVELVVTPKGGSEWRAPGVKAFLDSGSSISILSKETADKVMKKTGALQTSPAKIQTANGEKEATALKNAKLCLNGVCYQGHVLISDGIFGDILVGSDFLSKCRMDFPSRTLHCSGKKIAFEMEK